MSELVRTECFVSTTLVETCQENKSDLPFSISALSSTTFYQTLIKSREVSTIKLVKIVNIHCLINSEFTLRVSKGNDERRV